METFIKLFWFYGFYFDLRAKAGPRFNWFQVSFVTVISLLGCFYSVAVLHSVLKLKEDLDFDYLCMSSTLLLITFRIPITYVHCGLLMKKCNLLLHDLSAALDNITPVALRRTCLRKIRRWVTVAATATIVITISGACLSIYGLWLLKDDLPGSELLSKSDSTGLFLALQISVGIWYLFANSFPSVCAVFTVLICKLLIMCFDCYTPTKKVTISDLGNPMDPFSAALNADINIAQHQCHHERLSILVARANEVLSSYMLAFLIEQIVLILLYSKSGSNADWLAGLFLSLKQTIFFVATTVACSNVNEKLTTSLLRTQVHSYKDLQHCSPEHIHYMMYLSQNFSNTVKMTYGSFFTINKSFLFTIAGTTMTYTMVLKDINFA